MDRLLLFLGILFSGGDYLSFKISGMTFKLSQFIFVLFAIYMIINKKYKIIKSAIIYYLLIFIPHLLSLFYTKDFKSSFSYFIFVIFNFVIVINPIINYCKDKKNSDIVIDYVKIFRVIGILTILQLLLGSMRIFIPFFQNDIYKGIFRPALWFYEPSYLATFFCLYTGISLIDYIYNKNKKDLLLSWLFIAITTSSAGFIGIIISMFLIIILEKSILKKIKNICLLSFFVIIILGIISIIKFDIIVVFIGRLFKEGIANSSGLRSRGILEAYDIFKNYPFLGIGANAYKEYHFTKTPVTNVTLEILTNLGVIGFTLFFFYFINLYKKYTKYKGSIEIKKMWYSFIFFLIILQANQNYMRLYMWVHIALFIGLVRNIKNGVRDASFSSNS